MTDRPASASGETHSTTTSTSIAIPADAELLARTARGEQDAFRELINRHGRYLYGVAHSLADGNAADADDLVQETLVGALNAKFRGESSVKTWLVAILVRQAGLLRRRRIRAAKPQAVRAQADAARAAEAGTAGPDAVVDARLDLSVMLQQLSADHREVIVLRELEGMTYEQMAATLRVPRGTIESRLHRAREELRRRFRGYQP
jgi:RNA polymerase sigma-70 factor (ECF subfamily)